jgi:hypothetical protein
MLKDVVIKLNMRIYVYKHIIINIISKNDINIRKNFLKNTNETTLAKI